MKKLLAILMAVLMLGGVFAVGASAEMTNDELKGALAKVMPVAEAMRRFATEDKVQFSAILPSLMDLIKSDPLLRLANLLADCGLSSDFVINNYLNNSAWLKNNLEFRDALEVVEQALRDGTLDERIETMKEIWNGLVPEEYQVALGAAPGTNNPGFFVSVWNFILKWIFFGWLWMR